MALVMVSGLACSGRTGRSLEMKRYFEQKCRREREEEEGKAIAGESSSSNNNNNNMRIIRLSDKDANIRHSHYETQKREKPARAAYLSLIMRNLGKNTIVIADGGAGTNIKGFRYQLWCAARESGVRSASIFCVAKPEVCLRRNEERRGKKRANAEAVAAAVEEEEEGKGPESVLVEGEQEQEQEQEQDEYDDKTLQELLQRFEEPNAMTRWDSPLFVLDCNPIGSEEEEEGTTEKWEAAPLEAIWEAITKGKLTKAPDVVAPIRATTSNYLSLLETTSQLVLASFQELASFGTLPESGGEVRLSLTLEEEGGGGGGGGGDSKKVQLPLTIPAGQKAPTTAALHRLRRQFVKMHASGAAAGNELGHALSQEGRHTSGLASHGSSRAERKGQQHASSQSTTLHNSSQKRGVKEAPRSIEEDIARRFIAYLEESFN